MSENKAKLLYSGWLNAVEKAKEKTDYD